MKRGKPWYKSRVVWLNMITLGVGCIAIVAPMPEVAPYAPWLVAAQSMLNLVLRTLTNEPLQGGRP